MGKKKDREVRMATEPAMETEHHAVREDLAHRFSLYLNEVMSAPTEGKCRLEGFDLPGECKHEGECKLEDNWLKVFYVYAVQFLEDVFWAAHGDHKAAGRIVKLKSIFDKKGQPPFFQRACEIHVIMHQLRWVTAPHNEHELVELIEESENKRVYRVSDGKPNQPVKLRDLEALTCPSGPNDKFKALREQLKNSFSRPTIKDLYSEAEKHWHPKATLQSLAVDVYLTRHGYLRKDHRERGREALRRDLRKMRRTNLTVFVPGFDCGPPPDDSAWPMLTGAY